MNWYTNRFNQPAEPAKPKEPPVRNEWPEPEDDSKALENKEESSRAAVPAAAATNVAESSEAGGEHGEGS